MNIRRSLIISAVAIAGIIGGGIYLYPPETTLPASARESSKSVSAEAVFQAEFTDLTGKTQPLAQWQGKVLIVNFWATWCPPCLAEIPVFIQLQKEYGAQGVQFVGIAIDQKSKVQSYADEAGMNYPVLQGDLDGIDLARRTGNAQGGLPYTVIIDRSGNIVTTQLGKLSHEKLEGIIKPLL
jgi:thiol-disulfide isomerase/thioredoxin